MEISSPTHRLIQADTTGEFTVWPTEKRQLQVTEYRDGKMVREDINPPDDATKRLLAYANSVPLFAANFAGDGRFNIDLDCGFQRWSGTKPEHEVRAALRKCGFTSPQIKTVVKAAKSSEHFSIRRY